LGNFCFKTQSQRFIFPSPAQQFFLRVLAVACFAILIPLRRKLSETIRLILIPLGYHRTTVGDGEKLLTYLNSA
jgi:hypothetical protein